MRRLETAGGRAKGRRMIEISLTNELLFHAEIRYSRRARQGQEESHLVNLVTRSLSSGTCELGFRSRAWSSLMSPMKDCSKFFMSPLFGLVFCSCRSWVKVV